MNQLNEQKLDISGTEINGKTYIDADYLAALLAAAEKIKKQKEETQNILYKDNKIIDFKNDVRRIWGDCVAHGPRPWENKENVIGEALNVDYCFNKDKILEHADEIKQLLSQVHKATTYDELKILDSGENWTLLRQHVSMLMALGNALELVDFKENRLDWDAKETENPQISFKM